MNYKSPLLAILISLLLVFSGCAGNKDKTHNLQKVTVLLDWFPNTNHTGLYVAKDKGYYAEEGLEVEIIQPPEGGTAGLIASGQGDFGISYQEEVTVARAQDIPLVAIAAVIQHNTSGYASPVDRNIKTPADFEGKTYGGWGAPAETAILKALLKQYNADFNRVNIINIGSSDFFTSIQKDTDFSLIYWGWTGIEAQLRQIDLNFIRLNEENQALDFYTPVIISSEDKINNNPELVKKFMKATSRGYYDAINNPAEAAQIFIKSIPESNAELIKASQEYLAAEYQADAPRWGEMKSEVWSSYAEFMFNNGLIAKNIDIKKAFTNDFLPE